jgi:hypothetical protein
MLVLLWSLWWSQNWFNLTVLTLLLLYVFDDDIVKKFKHHLHEIADNADKGLIMVNFRRMRLLINEYVHLMRACELDQLMCSSSV